jgi:hypothetical protein
MGQACNDIRDRQVSLQSFMDIVVGSSQRAPQLTFYEDHWQLPNASRIEPLDMPVSK